MSQLWKDFCGSSLMPRTSATSGKLDVLRVECTKCPRKGRYSVRRLIEKYGRKGNMMKWKEQLNGDCQKRDAQHAQALGWRDGSRRRNLNPPAPLSSLLAGRAKSCGHWLSDRSLSARQARTLIERANPCTRRHQGSHGTEGRLDTSRSPRRRQGLC